jgi:ABC-type Na+ efflux pump permease subunit
MRYSCISRGWIVNKTYLIFKHEFLQAVKKAGFFILTFIVPVLALLAIGSWAMWIRSGSFVIKPTRG